MLFTSASARKYINRLSDRKSLLIQNERQNRTYRALDNEVPLVPDYDYLQTCQELLQIDETTRLIKHALNVFNTTKKLRNFDMCVDEALVYLAQLSSRKSTLQYMRSVPVKRRIGTNHDGAVEYEYINYDIEYADQDYDLIVTTIEKLQMDIDYINQTETFTVVLPGESDN